MKRALIGLVVVGLTVVTAGCPFLFLGSPTFTTFVNLDDPRLLTAVASTGEIITYFGERGADGLAESVSAILVEDLSGEETLLEVDDQGRLTKITAANGAVIEIEWISDTEILVSAISPEGVVQANVSVDLNNLPATAPATASVRKEGGVAKREENLEPRGGIGVALVELEDEDPAGAAVAANATATGTSKITVTRCGEPVENASVKLLVNPPNGSTFSVFAGHTGGGCYEVTLPVETTNPGKTAEEICESIAGVFGKLCTGLQLINPAAELQICGAIAAAIDAALLGPTGEGAAILVACEAGFRSARLACNTVGASPAPGAPSIADAICDQVDDAVNAVLAGDTTLTPIVTIPGQGVFTAPAKNGPPVPDFSVNAEDAPAIDSFTTNPTDPAPFQDYTTTAKLSCLPNNTFVTVSIVGTDGFTSSTNCTISGNGTCVLFVPGGAEGVLDVVTVEVAGGPTREVSLVF